MTEHCRRIKLDAPDGICSKCRTPWPCAVAEATDYVYYSITDEFPHEDIITVANLADDIIDKLLELGWRAP